MRISFVLPDANLGGGTRIIAIYAERLKQRGHDVLVVSTPLRPLGLRDKLRSLRRGTGWPGKPDRPPSHFDGVAVEHRVLERWRPIEDRDLPDADVVIATWWKTAEWVARLAPSKGAKAYFIQQYEANFGHPVDLVDRTWRLPLQKITCAQWLADLARDRFGDPHATASRNAIDHAMFHAPPRGKQGRPTVGMMYADSVVKACDVGLAAIAEVARQIPDLRLRVFGAMPPVPGLPLPSCADFIERPPQDRLRAIYAECDVYLCSSRSEGFAAPPYEAMACRCPVVSTRVGGPLELVEEGVNGFLVAVDDAPALADRLVRVLQTSEDQWRRMSDAAYATAGKYTWDEATDTFERALFLAIERAARGEIAGGSTLHNQSLIYR
jgi:glycosyltransferase involved in cell wall biosynthesis